MNGSWRKFITLKWWTNFVWTNLFCTDCFSKKSPNGANTAKRTIWIGRKKGKDEDNIWWGVDTWKKNLSCRKKVNILWKNPFCQSIGCRKKMALLAAKGKWRTRYQHVSLLFPALQGFTAKRFRQKQVRLQKKLIFPKFLAKLNIL